MDTTERTELIVRKLDNGALPAKPCAVLWGGTGTGVMCAACEEPIRAPQIEFECHADDGVVVHLCRPCYAIWHPLVARQL
jgi:hypothetical protein